MDSHVLYMDVDFQYCKQHKRVRGNLAQITPLRSLKRIVLQPYLIVADGKRELKNDRCHWLICFNCIGG